MTNEIHFLGEVLAKLRAVKHSKIKQIGVASGVPESTVRKLYYGEVINPRVQTVQALHDYFCRVASDQSHENESMISIENVLMVDETDSSPQHESRSMPPTKEKLKSNDGKTGVGDDQ